VRLPYSRTHVTQPTSEAGPRSNGASIEESALVCGVASESYWLALSAASRMDPAKRARRRVAGCASSAGFTADNLLSRPTAMRPAQKPAGWRSASRCRFKRLWYSAQFAISSRPSLGNRGGLKMDKILSSRFIAFYHAASAASSGLLQRRNRILVGT
jgi:hypothetical protein